LLSSRHQEREHCKRKPGDFDARHGRGRIFVERWVLVHSSRTREYDNELWGRKWWRWRCYNNFRPTERPFLIAQHHAWYS
jgi:hypothetical protein